MGVSCRLSRLDRFGRVGVCGVGVGGDVGVGAGGIVVVVLAVAVHTWHSTKWPIRAFAMTGIVTVSMISLIIFGSDMRATPPCARMSAGTRSSAMTATAPASSAMRAWEKSSR